MTVIISAFCLLMVAVILMYLVGMIRLRRQIVQRYQYWEEVDAQTKMDSARTKVVDKLDPDEDQFGLLEFGTADDFAKIVVATRPDKHKREDMRKYRDAFNRYTWYRHNLERAYHQLISNDEASVIAGCETFWAAELTSAEGNRVLPLLVSLRSNWEHNQRVYEYIEDAIEAIENRTTDDSANTVAGKIPAHA